MNEDYDKKRRKQERGYRRYDRRVWVLLVLGVGATVGLFLALHDQVNP